MGCNYLSMPLIPASGKTHLVQHSWIVKFVSKYNNFHSQKCIVNVVRKMSTISFRPQNINTSLGIAYQTLMRFNITGHIGGYATWLVVSPHIKLLMQKGLPIDFSFSPLFTPTTKIGYACKIISPLCRIYASLDQVSIGSNNGLSPIRRQAII